MPRFADYPSSTAPNNGDLLVIKDVVSNSTKNITRENILKGAPLPNNTVTTAAVTDGSITSSKLTEAYVRGVRQDDNNNSITNTSVTYQKLKFGWGQIVGNGTVVLTGTVTFDTAFTTTPVVMGGMLAAKAGSAATNIGQLVTANAAAVSCQIEDITTTTFAVSLRLSAGSFGSGDYFGFWWQAIG